MAQGQKSELMDILIARRWLDMFPDFDTHPSDVAPVESTITFRDFNREGQQA